MGQKLSIMPVCCETCGEKITDTKLISEFEVRANTKGRLIDGKYSRKHLNEYIETIYYGYCDNKHKNVITNINKL
jgi:hypothetical protein